MFYRVRPTSFADHLCLFQLSLGIFGRQKAPIPYVYLDLYLVVILGTK